MKQVIRYDVIGAIKEGVTIHPQKDVQQLGMVISAFQSISIADCVMMEVENLPDALPPYIQLSDYQFTNQ